MSSYEKIVTLFETAEHAEATKNNLIKAGFIYSPQETSVVNGGALPKSGTALREPGLWHRLFGGNIEQYEADVYSKAVNQGGAVLTLRAAEADVPKAAGLFNQHNLVDVQDRAVKTGVLPKAHAVPVAVAMPAKPLTTNVGKAEVLRLAEEQLDVGKKLVEQGTTRIRRFVTEKPVEAQVTLHEEHADVVRRAVSDPQYVKDIDWSDRTVEVRETAEQAVVSKSAHVAEEVVVGKTGSDRVETVRDTVRRQQVEVERVPNPGRNSSLCLHNRECPRSRFRDLGFHKCIRIRSCFSGLSFPQGICFSMSSIFCARAIGKADSRRDY